MQHTHALIRLSAISYSLTPTLAMHYSLIYRQSRDYESPGRKTAPNAAYMASVVNGGSFFVCFIYLDPY